MKIARRLLQFLIVAYALQAVLAFYFQFRPIASRDFKDERHLIRRGYLMPFSLFPAIGACGFFPEVAVTRTIYGKTGTKKLEKGFDIEADIYEAYPDVWPEHQRKVR